MTLKNRLFASAVDRRRANDSLYELVPQLEIISGLKVRREIKGSGTLTTHIEYANYQQQNKLVISNLSSFGVGLEGRDPPSCRVSLAT